MKTDSHLSEPILSELIRRNIIGFQEGVAIEFSHGIVSPGAYMNWRDLPSHPALWRKVIAEALPILSNMVGHNWEGVGIATVESGAIPHGAVIAEKCNAPFCYVRREPKAHGKRRRVEGDSNILVGRNLVLIEDVGTTGLSSVSAALALRGEGMTVDDLFILGTYDFKEMRDALTLYGLRMCSLVKFSDTLSIARNIDKLSERHESAIRTWLSDPRAKWSW